MPYKWVCFRDFSAESAYKPFAKSLTSEQASKSDIVYEERCIKEQIYFELLYVSAFSSPVKVSEIVFPVLNLEQSLKLYYKTVFVDHCESLALDWIRLFYRKLSSR